MLFDLNCIKNYAYYETHTKLLTADMSWVVSLQVLFISYTFISSSFAFISLCSYKKKSRQQTSV